MSVFAGQFGQLPDECALRQLSCHRTQRRLVVTGDWPTGRQDADLDGETRRQPGQNNILQCSVKFTLSTRATAFHRTDSSTMP